MRRQSSVPSAANSNNRCAAAGRGSESSPRRASLPARIGAGVVASLRMRRQRGGGGGGAAQQQAPAARGRSSLWARPAASGISDVLLRAMRWAGWAAVGQCEAVCSGWREVLADGAWFAFARDRYPATTLDSAPYGGSWRELCKDGNLRNTWLVVDCAPDTVCWWRYNLGVEMYYECRLRWFAVTRGGGAAAPGPTLRLCADARGEADMWALRSSELRLREPRMRVFGTRVRAVRPSRALLAVKLTGREAGQLDFPLDEIRQTGANLPVCFSFNGHEYYDAIPIPLPDPGIVPSTFTDREADVSTLKLVDRKLQWWANGALELDRVHMLHYDPGEKVLRVPGSPRLVAHIVSHAGAQLQHLLSSIADLAAHARVPCDGFPDDLPLQRRRFLMPSDLADLGRLRARAGGRVCAPAEMREWGWVRDAAAWAHCERAARNAAWGGGDVAAHQPEERDDDPHAEAEDGGGSDDVFDEEGEETWSEEEDEEEGVLAQEVMYGGFHDLPPGHPDMPDDFQQED